MDDRIMGASHDEILRRTADGCYCSFAALAPASQHTWTVGVVSFDTTLYGRVSVLEAIGSTSRDARGITVIEPGQVGIQWRDAQTHTTTRLTRLLSNDGK